MRVAYQRQLRQLTDELGGLCDLVAVALEQATRAVTECDVTLAATVLAGQQVVAHRRADAEQTAFGLLALQAPVATDLRIVVSAVHGAADIARMGALAGHIAQTARRRHPRPAVPDQIAGYVTQMGRVGSALAVKAGSMLRSRDLLAAGQLETDDDAMDELHRHLLAVLVHRDWSHGIPAAIDAALLARFYERYGDHAVALGRRVIYVATGAMPPAPDPLRSPGAGPSRVAPCPEPGSPGASISGLP